MSEEKKSPFQRPDAKPKNPFSVQPMVGKYGLTPFEDRKYRFQPENPDKADYFQVTCDKGEVVVQTHGGEIVDPDIARSIAYDILRTVDKVIYVYAGRNKAKNMTKIGMSQNTERRAQEVGIDVFWQIPCERFGERSARNVERALHDFFKGLGRHVEGEWFGLTLPLMQFLFVFKTGEEAIRNLPSLAEFYKKLMSNFTPPVNVDDAQKALDLLYRQGDVGQVLLTLDIIEGLIEQLMRQRASYLAYGLWFAAHSFMCSDWQWERNYWSWPYKEIPTSGSEQLPTGENDS